VKEPSAKCHRRQAVPHFVGADRDCTFVSKDSELGLLVEGVVLPVMIT
jgi:hypothetical protein